MPPKKCAKKNPLLKSKFIDRKRRLAVQLAAEAPLSGQQAYSKLALLTIQQSTAAQYDSQLVLLREYLAARGLRAFSSQEPVAATCSKEHYLQYLWALTAQGIAVPTGQHSALRKQQQVLALPMWTEDQDIRTALKGARYRGGHKLESTHLPRGTVTPEMLQSLVDLAQRTCPKFVPAIVVQYGCDLRISQLIALRSGHYCPSPPSLWIEVDKRETANTVDDPAIGPHWKDVWSPEARAYLGALQATTNAGELLFPRSGWTKPEYNRFLKEAAVTLGFPSDFKFDGSHVLRHGGAAAAVRTLRSRGIDAAQLPRIMKMSKPMVKHYSATLEERREKRK